MLTKFLHSNYTDLYVVIFPVPVSCSSMRLEVTGNCRYAHVKLEKWKDIIKLTRTVQNDNSIIKTTKKRWLEIQRKIFFSPWPCSWDLELHTTYTFVSYVVTQYNSDLYFRSCVSCGTWWPVYIKKNLEATFSPLQLKQQKNRSCFGKWNPGHGMTLLCLLVTHELNSMNQ
jgi:hypothetical protein